MYSKEDLITLRRYINEITEEEQAEMPFGMQSEIFKLGEAIVAKFESTSNLFKLKSAQLK